MNDFEYALRTITLATGAEIELAHAVQAGSIIAACGTVAQPLAGSQWADTDPGARCAACEAAVAAMRQPTPVPVVVTPAPVPAPAPVAPRPEMVPEAPSLPAAEPGPSVRDRAAALWRGLDRRAQLALAGGTALLVLVVILLATGVFSGDDFTPDQNSPDYRNGYGYGHNLMTVTTNPTNECAEAVAGLGGTDDRNWNAGCRAGYADAHH